MVARAHGFTARWHHHRFGHFAQGVGRGIGAEALVVFELGNRRVGKEFEIIVGQAVTAMDDCGALGLNADANARTGKGCRRDAEE